MTDTNPTLSYTLMIERPFRIADLRSSGLIPPATRLKTDVGLYGVSRSPALRAGTLPAYLHAIILDFKSFKRELQTELLGVRTVKKFHGSTEYYSVCRRNRFHKVCFRSLAVCST